MQIGGAAGFVCKVWATCATPGTCCYCSPCACAGEAEDAGPPYALLEHTPLAVLTNGMLAAMNELRHCAPLSLAAPVAQTLQVQGFPTRPQCRAPNVLPSWELAIEHIHGGSFVGCLG